MGTITLVFGKLRITGTFKESNEIKDCPVGKKVHLCFGDDINYTGIYMGIAEDDNIILQSVSSSSRIGLPVNRLTSFFQET